MTNNHKKGEPLKPFKRYYQTYRHDQELKRLLLNFLYEEGPSSVTHIEYSIEINNGVMKRIMKDLLGAGLIGVGHPDNIVMLPEKRNRLNDNVVILLYITDLGNRCRGLMNERNALLVAKH